MNKEQILFEILCNNNEIIKQGLNIKKDVNNKFVIKRQELWAKYEDFK